MAVPWGLVVLLIGVAYGWLSPGKQDKSHIFKTGIIWGLVIAVVVALLGLLFKANPLGLGDVGFLSLFISFVVMTILFIVGVWIGDLLEGRGRTTRGMRRV